MKSESKKKVQGLPFSIGMQKVTSKAHNNQRQIDVEQQRKHHQQPNRLRSREE